MIVTLKDFDNETQKLEKDINKFLAAKLFSNVYEQPRIYEYDIQIVEKSTLFQVVDEHYLLLNKIHLKEFYKYWRTYFLKRETDHIEFATVCILLINPEFLSAWSSRKNLLELKLTQKNIDHEAMIVKEIDFNRLILMKNFKSEHAYIHRRWLIKKYIQSITKNSDPIKVEQFFSEELKLIYATLAPKIKANYYCWTYLNWIVGFLYQKNLDNFDLNSLIKRMLLEFERLLYINPSDFCLFHTRLNLVKILTRLDRLHLFINRDFKKTILTKDVFFLFLSQEYRLFDDLLVRYPEYSTIWNYRKYFLFYILEFKQNNHMIQCEGNIDFDLLNNELELNFQNKYPTSTCLKNECDQNWIDTLIKRENFISCLFIQTIEDDSISGAKAKRYSSDFVKYLSKFVSSHNTKIIN